MKLHVVDFSQDYFVGLLGETLPTKRHGKLVVVEGEGARYALFSPMKLSPYHANIVERFFDERGLLFDNDAENGTTRPRSPGWTVQGGGRWEIDEARGELWIFGESMAYGRADLGRLAKELRAASAFGGARITVGSPPTPDR